MNKAFIFHAAAKTCTRRAAKPDSGRVGVTLSVRLGNQSPRRHPEVVCIGQADIVQTVILRSQCDGLASIRAMRQKISGDFGECQEIRLFQPVVGPSEQHHAQHRDGLNRTIVFVQGTDIKDVRPVLQAMAARSWSATASSNASLNSKFVMV